MGGSKFHSVVRNSYIFWGKFYYIVIFRWEILLWKNHVIFSRKKSRFRSSYELQKEETNLSIVGDLRERFVGFLGYVTGK